jgi:hypothetical protein
MLVRALRPDLPSGLRPECHPGQQRTQAQAAMSPAAANPPLPIIMAVACHPSVETASPGWQLAALPPYATIPLYGSKLGVECGGERN